MNITKRSIYIYTILFLLVVLSSCGGKTSSGSDNGNGISSGDEQETINENSDDGQVEQKATVLDVNKSDVFFKRSGGDETISVNCDIASWIISSKPSWVNISRDNNTLTISCTRLTGTEDRSEQIDLNAGDLACSILVTQTAAVTTFEVTPKEITIPINGGTYTFNVETDADSWDVSSYNSKLNISKNSNSFSVNFPRTEVYGMAYYSIEVKSNSSNAKSVCISVKQTGKCEICRGTGKQRCFNCDGWGTVEDLSSVGLTGRVNRFKCGDCGGVGSKQCSICHGSGLTN